MTYLKYGAILLYTIPIYRAMSHVTYLKSGPIPLYTIPMRSLMTSICEDRKEGVQ